MTAASDSTGFLKSTYPVLFPSHPAFTLPQDQFEEFLRKDLEQKRKDILAKSEANFPTLGGSSSIESDNALAETETATVNSLTSTWAQIAEAGDKLLIKATDDNSNSDLVATANKPTHPFMKGLLRKIQEHNRPNVDSKMLTQNADVAYRSTTNALVDLFFELNEISKQRLDELLQAAWDEDPLSTLKIIFNARSIHLGKSSRVAFYQCVGWLAQHHPQTCLHNLKWLSRPVIEKKIEKKEHDEDDMVLVEEEKDDNDLTKFDVWNGVAHGYYKDLLNLLVLAVNDKFDTPREVLNIEKQKNPKEYTWDMDDAKAQRHDVRDMRHEHAVAKFDEDGFYRGLHITVARIFAEQLAVDLNLLRKGDKLALRQISLCAKWAPSSKLFHDKHTFVASSIAELLHPQSLFKNINDREVYLRHARESYRKDIASLRKALQIVERDISAEKFENIKYDRVPSLAMNQYASLFASKDEKRFDEYLERVSGGKSSISGATLLPSTLIHQVRHAARPGSPALTTRLRGGNRSFKAMRDAKVPKPDVRVCNAQWKTLVQRIKDSGTMESSMAVCDVSGSMSSPAFADGSCPMDSAIGLSLLLAEVVQPPFGGAFITFSAKPTVQQIDLSKPLHEKVNDMERAEWDTNTNFTAVFNDLILPMARENNLCQEDMIKRIFVFSDMQFDSAQSKESWWSTSFERIKKKFESYGYEMPELVFWNLAGGNAGSRNSVSFGNYIAPKPVSAAENGTSLVSGYSQALLKVFLDSGGFEEPEEPELVEKEVVNETGDDFTVLGKKRRKLDPLNTVKKAISHKAYSMLTVVD